MKSAQVKIRRPVGLRDIAHELNLSVSLVSKVLSGRMGTSGSLPETVRAIREKAQELGYRKNLQAESLRTGRLNVIAVLVHYHGAEGSQIVETMVEGIAREAAKYQQRLMLHYYTTLDELKSIWNEFSRNAVDGVILGGVPHMDWVNELNSKSEEGIAVIGIISSEAANCGINVGMSEGELCRRATLHLLDRGCKNIAHFRVMTSEHKSFASKTMGQVRYEGYVQALRERGLPLRNELVIQIEHFYYESGIEATEKLLASGVCFDGIVGQSDHHTAGALNTLVRHGVRVPQDVKLIGVDNSPFCRMASVPLSSVSQEFALRGQTAVRMLMKKIAGEDTSSINIEPVLHERESTSKERAC